MASSGSGSDSDSDAEHPGKPETDRIRRELDRVVSEIDSCVAAIDGDARHLTKAKGTSIGVGVTNLRGYCQELSEVLASLEARVDQLEEDWQGLHKVLVEKGRKLKKKRRQVEDFRCALVNYVGAKKKKKLAGADKREIMQRICNTINDFVSEDAKLDAAELAKIFDD